MRGHRVQKSLIRSRFSPMETTGQRYIYTGCSTGRIISNFYFLICLLFFAININFLFLLKTVYDILTGNIVETIDAHSDIVRDVVWHPYRQEILSYSVFLF